MGHPSLSFLHINGQILLTIYRPLLHCAIFVHACLVECLCHHPRSVLPTHAWEACLQLSAQVHRAELYGWHLAAQRLERELLPTLLELVSELSDVHSKRSAARQGFSILPVLDIYQDLLAIEEE